MFGEVPKAGTSVVVSLADGSRPEVLMVGMLWASEWVSSPQRATASIGGEDRVMRFDAPLMNRRGPSAETSAGWCRQPPFKDPHPNPR